MTEKWVIGPKWAVSCNYQYSKAFEQEDKSLWHLNNIACRHESSRLERGNSDSLVSEHTTTMDKSEFGFTETLKCSIELHAKTLTPAFSLWNLMLSNYKTHCSRKVIELKLKLNELLAICGNTILYICKETQFERSHNDKQRQTQTQVV